MLVILKALCGKVNTFNSFGDGGKTSFSLKLLIMKNTIQKEIQNFKAFDLVSWIDGTTFERHYGMIIKVFAITKQEQKCRIIDFSIQKNVIIPKCFLYLENNF